MQTLHVKGNPTDLPAKVSLDPKTGERGTGSHCERLHTLEDVVSGDCTQLVVSVGEPVAVGTRWHSRRGRHMWFEGSNQRFDLLLEGSSCLIEHFLDRPPHDAIGREA
jgi:hypothetical protein